METLKTLKINYINNSSELCEIGRHYDTDKSSQRSNVTNTRHCHPYTLFYDGLFKHKRNAPGIKIAELGILDGASLLMWREYFKFADIYGFEYNQGFIANFKRRYNNNRITLAPIDVTIKENIAWTFERTNVLFDIIIDDTTHQFEDQINVIQNTWQWLKPGGILIIEDIFKAYDENNYIERLKQLNILNEFQDYYFVELDHVNRNSTGWDNDKLFILTRKTPVTPLFKSPNKITIITPSYRVDNLLEIEKSIDFNYVDEWIIVYDGSKITKNPSLFHSSNDDTDTHRHKIKEYIHTSEGMSGNPQRNFALTMVSNPNTLLYYLDDDNIIHPNLYKLLDVIDNDKMYTFNQFNRINGNNINIGCIDTAMTIIPFNLCKDERWILNKYDADGYYIMACYDKIKNKHVYVNNCLCFYNKLIV